MCRVRPIHSCHFGVAYCAGFFRGAGRVFLGHDCKLAKLELTVRREFKDCGLNVIVLVQGLLQGFVMWWHVVWRIVLWFVKSQMFNTDSG